MTHIDDTLSRGSDQFIKETTSNLQKFEAKDKEFDNIKFAGVYIETLKNGFKLHQTSYVERIKPLPKCSPCNQFNSARASIT